MRDRGEWYFALGCAVLGFGGLVVALISLLGELQALPL